MADAQGSRSRGVIGIAGSAVAERQRISGLSSGLFRGRLHLDGV
jgi:hypothetical protein